MCQAPRGVSDRCDTIQQVKSPKRIEWLPSIPAVIGVALGIIYAVGAVTIYGQLKNANLNAIQAMGLIPLEEILGRGIGQMVSQLGQAIVEVGLIALLIGFLYTTKPNSQPALEAPTKPDKSLFGRLDRLFSSPQPMLVIMAVGLIFILVGMPLNEAGVLLIAAAASTGTLIAIWRFTAERDEHGPRRIFVVYVVVGLTFLATFNKMKAPRTTG